ncbi:hypothetical protein NX722_26575 [Endozoicomonas gorgoniicola]|uniref:OTU domain-containing protein n=1 Tax=Endozoicomonas gorgoniicola TaxID=1234144 RepID=A0ABT3N3C2_9GAMM|nr:hypothetical protein [Endozoicomonas gorgoniicola]MCW7556128.1 hypothetical protein [Endozoicomonas gorgoniicola]
MHFKVTLYKYKIYFYILLLSLISVNVFAFQLSQKQISVIKQFDYEDYQKIESKIKLIRKNDLDSYISLLMENRNTNQRNRYFREQSKKVGHLLDITVSPDSNKKQMPYGVLRAFNLVQAIIYFHTRNRTEDDFITIPTENKDSDYKWLIEIISNYADEKLITEDRGNLWSKNPESAISVNQKSKDGKVTTQSPMRNPAAKAREVYFAVNNLRNFLEQKYPGNFEISVDDHNMLEVSLDFVAPTGWWQGAFFRVIFNFDNIGDEGAEVDVQQAPPVSHLIGNKLCLMQIYKNSERYPDAVSGFNAHQWWFDNCNGRVRYGSNNYSIEQQVIQVINFMSGDFDIKDEGFLAYLHATKKGHKFYVSAAEEISQRIHNNNLDASRLETSLTVETNLDKIKEAANTRITPNGDPNFDYLVYDEADNKKEHSKTRIFLPVEMYKEAEIVEFNTDEIENTDEIGEYHDIVFKAIKETSFYIPEGIEPKIYYKRDLIDKEEVSEKVFDAEQSNRKENPKRTDNKNSKLTMIVKVPNYEERAFKKATEEGSQYYTPENPDILCSGVCTPKEIEWEIHLVPGGKKRAKDNNMVNQYHLMIPRESMKPTERYRGGFQYGSQANVWIPMIREDMSEAEKEFAVTAMYDLSKRKLALPNEKKYIMANKGNHIITKSLLKPDKDVETWQPTQAFLEILLQGVQMSILIAKKDYSIVESNNLFFEHALKGELKKNTIEDLAFFLGQLTPSLKHLSNMDYKDIALINQRIMINYLIEICVRTLLREEFGSGSELVNTITETPESFKLSDIINTNKTGIQVAFNTLALMDFLTQKIVFTENSDSFKVSESEVESLQINIKNLYSKMESSKDFLPSLLDNLLPTAKYSPTGIDFNDDHFKNKFRLAVLEKYQQRSGKKEVKRSLGKYFKETIGSSSTDNDPIFDTKETEALINTFRENTPKRFINEKTVTGTYKQTCYHCGEVYETTDPISGSRRNKQKHHKENNPRLIKPLHNKECKEKDKCIRTGAKKLYDQMESQYPQKQINGPVNHYNPVPEGYELIRVNGDGNCMYSSIAEIYNRHQPSEEMGAWNQQAVRDTIERNLRSINDAIQNHPRRSNLLQELELLTGLNAEIIPAIIENRVITQSAAEGDSELGVLQQFGDTQLIPLLAPTQSVRFSVITQGLSGLNTGVYDLNLWVTLAPNLLAALLANPHFSFPDLSDTERLEIAELLPSDVNRARRRIASITSARQAIGHLIHYPNAISRLEHFDAAVRIDTSQDMEVDLEVDPGVDPGVDPEINPQQAVSFLAMISLAARLRPHSGNSN